MPQNGSTFPRAFTLIDSLAALAIVGLFAAIGWPSLGRALEKTELRLATGEVAAAFYQARVYALRQSANVAVAFEVRDNGVFWTLYRDGDGDGVLREDIRRGKDVAVTGAKRLERFGARVRFGFPPGKAPVEIGDPTRRIQNLDRPLRFGGSDMASFSARGTATPGTVYLTGGNHRLMAVRVTSLSGKVSLWEYNPEIQRWKRI